MVDGNYDTRAPEVAVEDDVTPRYNDGQGGSKGSAAALSQFDQGRLGSLGSPQVGTPDFIEQRPERPGATMKAIPLSGPCILAAWTEPGVLL